jgi:TolB-like protein
MVAKPPGVYNKSMGKARMLIALFLLAGFVSPWTAGSQSRTALVVLPFSGAGLSKTELADLTQVFEESLAGVESLQVIDQTRREKVLAYLDPALLTSVDIASAVKVGEALSAAIVVMGTVISQNGMLSVKVRIITVATGKMVSTESAGVASAAELSQAVRIIASALFGTPFSDSPEGEGRTETLAKQQRFSVLESLQADLKESIAQIDRKRARARTSGWVTLGIGVAATAFSGVSWYLADLAYQEYQSTHDTTAAAYYHRKVTLWDTLMFLSAGTGVLSVGVSIPFFALSPNSRAEKEELKRVESEMVSLGVPGGIEK